MDKNKYNEVLSQIRKVNKIILMNIYYRNYKQKINKHDFSAYFIYTTIGPKKTGIK